jgi:hypothetical protein
MILVVLFFCTIVDAQMIACSSANVGWHCYCVASTATDCSSVSAVSYGNGTSPLNEPTKLHSGAGLGLIYYNVMSASPGNVNAQWNGANNGVSKEQFEFSLVTVTGRMRSTDD